MTLVITHLEGERNFENISHTKGATVSEERLSYLFQCLSKTESALNSVCKKLYYKIVREEMIRDYAVPSRVGYPQFAKQLISKNVIFMSIVMFVAFASFL